MVELKEELIQSSSEAAATDKKLGNDEIPLPVGAAKKHSADHHRQEKDGTDDSHTTECATDEESRGPDEVDAEEETATTAVISSNKPDTFVERKNVLVCDHQGYRGIFTGRLCVVPSGDSSNGTSNGNGDDKETLLPDGQGSIKYEDHPDFASYSGMWSQGAFEGQGMAVHINGDSYSGMHKAGLRHGSGTYSWADGRNYSGSFHEGLRHGQGCYTWPGGISYSGSYERGVRSGYGKYLDEQEGIEYVGDWRDGVYHGYGVLSIREEDGNRVYRGNFENGRAHGQGVEFHPDGSIRHDGQWENDQIVGSSKKNVVQKPTNPLMVVQNEEVCDATGLKGIYRGILHLESRLPHGNGVMKYADKPQKDSKTPDECLEEYEGCFDMGRYHGRGRLRWKNKDCYDGDFVDGKKHGKGVYRWHDGRQYKGDFFEDKRHGFGTFIYSDKHSSDVYTGEFRDGRRHGQGRFVFQDGSVYEGSWEKGRYNGHGKLVSSTSRTYVGDFKDGLAHGHGKETGPDGKVIFEGLWIHGDTEPQAKRKADLAQKRKDAESSSQKSPPEPPCEAVVDVEVQDADGNRGQYTGLVLSANRKPHGVGRMVYLDGRRIYEGFFVAGSKCGHGRTFFVQQKDFHEGSYKDNLRHGPGKYRWKDGREFVGNYENDMRHGEGVFTYPNGDKFEGIFEYGEKQFGRFSFSNGYYEGSWIDNKYEGRGRLVVDDEVFDGIFREGSFVEQVKGEGVGEAEQVKEEGDDEDEADVKSVDPDHGEFQTSDETAAHDPSKEDIGTESITPQLKNGASSVQSPNED